MSTEDKNYNLDSPIFSYLEFGAVNLEKGSKQVYDYRMHNKAYDWLMHARYSHDMFTYGQMTQALKEHNLEKVATLYSKEIHHKNDYLVNLNKKNALDLTGSSFFELGQTLFGCIEALEFINQLENHIDPQVKNKLDLSSVQWLGVDISSFFNYMAEKLHSTYNVSVSDKLESIPNKLDVFFAKGITLLYAIDSAESLYKLISKAHISVFDYSISLCEQRDDYIGTGKAVRFLGWDEFQSFYENVLKSGKEIWLRGNSKPDPQGEKLYLEGIITDDETAQRFIDIQKRSLSLLMEKSPNLYDALIHEKSSDYFKWKRFSDIL